MRAKRILLVTLGLMVAGSVFGGVAGAVLMILLGLTDGWLALPPSPFLAVGVTYGAVHGAVLGPIGAWLLMREVPLGIAVGGTTLGTVIGGGLAFALEAPGSIIYAPIVGFSVAAVALRAHARQRRGLRGIPSDARLTA